MRTKNDEIMESIVAFIDDCYFSDGTVPSQEAIGNAVSLAKGRVNAYLSEMAERGMLEYNAASRKYMTQKMIKANTGIRRIPLVGEIACGRPILAEENIETYVTLSADVLGRGDYFALRAKGESMINAGIEDGDFVIVRRQSTADEGDIVVALIEDEATLKRYFLDRARQKIRLHPENDTMRDMFFDYISIQGVAEKVMKIRSVR